MLVPPEHHPEQLMRSHGTRISAGSPRCLAFARRAAIGIDMGVINGVCDQHRERWGCEGGCMVRAVSSGARFHCSHQAPTVEEGDAVVEDR